MENNQLTTFRNTVKFDQGSIWIKPVCEMFGINYKTQLKRISSDLILSKQTFKNSDVETYGNNRQRLLLSKKGFVRWIQLLNPNMVKEELQDKLISYQELIFDYLYGEAKEEQKISISRTRLKKLKRLRRKISSEITKEESNIDKHIAIICERGPSEQYPVQGELGV